MAIGGPYTGPQAANTSNATTLTVTYPAVGNSAGRDIVAGDVLVLYVTPGAGALATVPGGWTSIAAFSNTGNTVSPGIMVAWKVAAGTESGTTLAVTTPSAQSAGYIQAFPGVDTTTPIPVTPSTLDQTSNTTSPVITGITTVNAGAMLLLFGGMNSTAATTTSATAATAGAMTVDGQRGTSTRALVLASKLLGAAGATGNVTTVYSGTARHSQVLFALTPAAAGTTPVTKSTAVTWNVREAVTDPQAQTWNVRTVVTDTNAVAWNVAAVVAAKTTATTWNVAATVTKTSASTWNVATVVPAKTTASTWNVRQTATQTTYQEWDVLGVLTTVTKSNAVAWGVRTSVTQTTYQEWDVFVPLSAVTKTSASTWNVRAAVTATNGSTWKVTTVVTQSAASTWRVATVVVKTTGSTWNVRAVVVDTNAVTWNVRAAATQTRPITWDVYPVGVAVTWGWAGAPTDTGFVVTAKTVNTTSVRLAVSTSSSMTSPVYSSPVTPDGNGRVRCTIIGLAANTQHWWQIEDTPAGMAGVLLAVPGVSGNAGKAKTLPAAGTAAGFTVTLGSCYQSGTDDPVAVNNARTWAPDFQIHTGDMFYNGSNSSTDPEVHAAKWDAALGLASHGQRDYFRDVPMYYCVSDGETLTDNGDSNNAWTQANIDGWKKVVPYGTLADVRSTTEHRGQTWVVGRVRFILVDCKTHERSPGADAQSSSKTMLGATQLAWLKARLSDPEPLKVIVCDPGWMGPAATDNGPDKWWSYDDERADIINYITTNNIAVDLWHGDTHQIATATKAKNTWGGFPVVCGSPYNSPSGGRNQSTFSQKYADAGGSSRQYMRISFTDTGSLITRTASGWDAVSDTEKVNQVDTWSTLGTVTKTSASTWKVREVVTDPNPVTWNVRSVVTATVATSWAVTTVVPVKTSASTWAVRAAVTQSRASAWNLRAFATKTNPVTWGVAGKVTSSTAVTWNVATTVPVKTAASTWAVRFTVPVKTAASTWKVREQVTGLSAQTWNVAAAVSAVTKSVASTWKVTVAVGQTRASTWAVRAPVTVTNLVTWNVAGRPVATATTTWAVRAAVTRTQVSSWSLRAAVFRPVALSWQVRERVTKTQPNSWRFLEAPILDEGVWLAERDVSAILARRNVVASLEPVDDAATLEPAT